MVDINEFEADRTTTWCPGCGNFPLRKALAKALTELDLKPEKVAVMTGIGQAAKMPHYFRTNGFNGLHGRALPPAVAVSLLNPTLTVVAATGDGDGYGEGGNHLLHTIRRNPNLAHFVHNNQIYGLTKGQASPTTHSGLKTEVQPDGVTSAPFNPLSFAVGMGASFIARSFVGKKDHLVKMMKAAIKHRGYALLDILQPCVTFNKVNTYQWYSQRVYELTEDYNAADKYEAFKKAQEWGEEIPIGIIYQEEKPTFRDNFSHLPDHLPLEHPESDTIEEIIDYFA
ncbi:MAG: thiamine pyrophosphate-dependent enzyme [Bacillota bacterium]